MLKPIFFIFNLVFATWLVLKIEKIQPSDFGEYKSLFYSGPKPKMVTIRDKEVLKKLCFDYKEGKINNADLEKRLEKFLAPPEEQANAK